MSEKQTIVVNLSDRAAKVGFVANLNGLAGEWKIEMKPYRHRRTLKQNAFYWAAVVPSFREFMRSQGQYFNDDECHEFLLQTHAGRSVIDPETGESMAIIGTRSSRMDIEEFSAYVNRCIEWMYDKFGVVVLEPEYGVKK